jgi:hypothetical protein
MCGTFASSLGSSPLSAAATCSLCGFAALEGMGLAILGVLGSFSERCESSERGQLQLRRH